MQYKKMSYFSSFKTFFLPIATLSILYCCCKNEGSREHLQLFGKQNITFLDSTRAAAAVSRDDREHFFTKVTPLDMALQLHESTAGAPRDSMLLKYKNFLKTDVLHFTTADEALLKRIFTDIHRWCRQLSPHIFPKNIKLIKTRGRYYGKDAYYTRENTIIIPAEVLETPNERAVRETLIHEVFHIYSRLNPKKRAELYELIGFKKLDGALQLPPAVQSRLLLNPDGIDFAYAIRLAQTPGDTLHAVPILTANAPTYLPERTVYFDYILFNLYPIEKQEDGSYQVVITPEGLSPLRVNEQRDFFKQITDNTLYILHPDEILADNFKFLVLAQSGEAAYRLSRFSQEGQALLQQITVVLGNYPLSGE
jgi:hypothetical protein